MGEIGTGAILLGISGVALTCCLGINIAHKQAKKEHPDFNLPTSWVIGNLIALFLFIACGFSGCGIFIRGVIR